MSLALLSILPQDVAQQVNGYAIQLSVTQRLTNGWKEIHEEMSWRGGCTDSCNFHWCPVQNCTCYCKFPGFLLRRVNSNWIPVNGTIMPSAMLELESQATQEEYWDEMELAGEQAQAWAGDEMDWEPTNHDQLLDYAAEMDYDHDADYREDQAMAWM
tara:strand:+ start:535 stop:1005 length:471 start_codon:yes stop_codon:yes gene_type:complete